VNRTFHPLLAHFVLSSSISIDTWELFHRIQLLQKRKREREQKKGESEKEKIKRE
jgi:hypothetical protein